MRVALVSPYSWTYPGGVTRHVEALAGELGRRGHEVRVFAPWDPPDGRARLAHRGVLPQRVAPPPWLVPLGRTVGWSFNGAVSNVVLHPSGILALREALRAYAPDVVHLHEPVVPNLGWDTLTDWPGPLVGTFHTYGTSRLTHGVAALGGSRRWMRRLDVRIAVSEAARWTGRRFHGGEYRVIPNGVALPAGGVPPPRPRVPGDVLRVVCVGPRVARKGLPVLERAFEALAAEVPAALELVGADGPVTEAERAAALARADVLVAPSLGGESFGMVLTEAFAAGLPVVASGIAGYRDVVRHRVEGLLVAPGEPVALGEALRELALDPALTARLAARAAARAEVYAWPRVAAQVEEAYADALATRAAASFPRGPRRWPVPIPPLEPAPSPRARLARGARRGAPLLAVTAVAAAGALALRHGHAAAVAGALARSSPAWVLVALTLMAASMLLRAGAWRALLAAAVPDARIGLAATFRATAVGVLLSAALPARLGEPARGLLVARRLGRPRDRLPAVLGTLVAQTLLNLLALAGLGAAVLATAGPWADPGRVLVAVAAVPAGVALAVTAAPVLLRCLPALRGPAERAREGLWALRDRRHGAQALAAQLGAWVLQWLACWALLQGVGLGDRAAAPAAAGVLLAVNVTAVVPLTPANVGVFQAACVAVLVAYGVAEGPALAYGVVLQGVEVAVAVVLGVPAVVREGVGWRELRAGALREAPVHLGPRVTAAGPHPAGGASPAG